MRVGSEHAGWRCLYFGVMTGGGLALRFGPQRRFLVLALAETDLGAGPAFSDANGYRVGGGGELLLLGGAGDCWRFELGARSAYFFLGERGLVLRTHAAQSILLTRRFALRASFDTTGDYAQGTGELVAYF